MKCFYHDDRDAVGLCKSCQKAVCRDCAVDLGKGLACRDHCEEDVRNIIALVERNLRYQPAITAALARTRKTRIGAVIFHLVSGGCFIYWGLQIPDFRFIAVMGVCYTLYGCFGASQIPKYPVAVAPTKPKL